MKYATAIAYAMLHQMSPIQIVSDRACPVT